MNNEMKQDYEEAMERLRNCARLDTVAEYVKELEAKVVDLSKENEDLSKDLREANEMLDTTKEYIDTVKEYIG